MLKKYWMESLAIAAIVVFWGGVLAMEQLDRNAADSAPPSANQLQEEASTATVAPLPE